VAVKILHAHLAQDESFVARFRTEAVAAARLRHPSIVSIYDTSGTDGLQAIVMELVRGQNLRQRLDQVGTLSPREAVHIGAEVADALAAAHRAGLVHRDIKPANIMLCDDHRVVVTDFGIAKVRGETDLTQTGLLIGSVKYLSPEQVEGKKLDGRSDVYSLAIVLYESLCGRPPFAAESDAATALQRLQTNPPRIRQLKPGVPRALETVVLRGMARDPTERYQSAADFRAALLAAPLRDEPAPATPARAAAKPIVPPRPAPAPAPARRTQTPPSFTRSERSWLIPTLVIILVALCLALAGVLFGRTEAGKDLFGRAQDAVDESQGSADPPDPSELVPIVEAIPFDPPPGDGRESNGSAAALLDGDPSTEWSTEGYRNPNGRHFGGLKDGVGVVLVLDGSHVLDELAVTGSSNDWSAQIYVADAPQSTLEAWGDPVSVEGGLGTDAAFDLDGAEGAAVLLWLTDLGDEAPHGSNATVHAHLHSVAVVGS
jgi:hypothetical protein